MTSGSDINAAADATAIEDGVLVVREGPAANCSSIGSVVDTLFVTAVLGSAIFAAIAAALAKEDVEIVGDGAPAEKAVSEKATARPDDVRRDDVRRDDARRKDDDAPSS